MPRNITATVNGPNSITASWQEPETTNGIIIRYLVNVTRGSESVMNEMTVETNFTAMDLLPFTEYTFDVAAVTSAGAGMSGMATATTAQDGKGEICNRSVNILMYINYIFLQLLQLPEVSQQWQIPPPPLMWIGLNRACSMESSHAIWSNTPEMMCRMLLWNKSLLPLLILLFS